MFSYLSQFNIMDLYSITYYMKYLQQSFVNYHYHHYYLQHYLLLQILEPTVERIKKEEI